jgi:hypothetical protein
MIKLMVVVRPDTHRDFDGGSSYLRCIVRCMLQRVLQMDASAVDREFEPETSSSVSSSKSLHSIRIATGRHSYTCLQTC